MLTSQRIDDAALALQLRSDYLRTLIAPMDGMWESTVIARAALWDLRDQGRLAGSIYLDGDELLRVHFTADYQGRASEIFAWLLATHAIRTAVASTVEPMYLSLCLDQQRAVAVHSYLFRDNVHAPAKVLSDPAGQTFRLAVPTEYDVVMAFYQANVEGPGEWIESFIRDRLDRGELHGLFDGQTLIAAGECIPSALQPPYADLGMVVARSRRGEGLGSLMLVHLKTHCYSLDLTPICSCTADNSASRRAIERAGFVAGHRMLRVTF